MSGYRPRIGAQVRAGSFDTVWTVWSQAPGGWWLYRTDAAGKTVWLEARTRDLSPVRTVVAR